MENFIKIEFNGKIYNINKEKVNLIIQILENSSVPKSKDLKISKSYTTEEITKILEKFKLDDEYFLENINKA